MSRDAQGIQSKQLGEKEMKLPFFWSYKFTPLGVILDCNRHSQQYSLERRRETIKRLRVLTKVGNIAWGLERRNLALTAHALLESVLNNDLATTGAHSEQREQKRNGTRILNGSAERNAGANICVRAESLVLLANLRGKENRSIPKNAGIFDRILRAKGPAAEQETLQVDKRKKER